MGSYLSEPVTEKHSDNGTTTQYSHGSSAMQGWRKGMEDSHVHTSIGDDVALYAVFDGHGGAQVADFCQRHIAEVVISCEQYKGCDYGGALTESFKKIDEFLETEEAQSECGLKPVTQRGPESEAQHADMQRMLVLKRMLQGGKVTAGGGSEGDAKVCTLKDHAVTSGCTAVVAIVSASKIYVANAGDSRGVLCRGGSTVPLSFDHKPSQEREIARITGAGGFVTEANGHHRVNGNLNLSRSLGDMKYKQNQDLPWTHQLISAEPDIIIEDIRDEDEFFVLACDGIWDVMSNEQCIEFIRERMQRRPRPPLSEICEDALAYCLTSDPKASRGIGSDNMTMVIVDLKSGACPQVKSECPDRKSVV